VNSNGKLAEKTPHAFPVFSYLTSSSSCNWSNVVFACALLCCTSHFMVGCVFLNS